MAKAGVGSSGTGPEIRRVKVYQLNEIGQWDDKGTGNVIMAHNETGRLVLTVRHEESGDDLLNHTVDPELEYSRQGETIITWCESVGGIDLALSFQENKWCNEVYEAIRPGAGAAAVAAAVGVANAQGDGVQSYDGVVGDPEGAEIGSEGDPSNGAVVTAGVYASALPIPDPSNLEELSARIGAQTMTAKEHICASVMNAGFLPKLFEIFRAAETSLPPRLEQLHSLFGIFKGIFMLNDCSVLEQVLNEENIMPAIACLEYDPELPPGTSFTRHREFMAKANFKQVVPIVDEDVLSKIHQNYRMTYIKDVILLKYLDDPTMGTLTSIIFFNNVVIVSRLSDNATFMKELFGKLIAVAGMTAPGVKRWQTDSKDDAQGQGASMAISKDAKIVENGIFGPLKASDVTATAAAMSNNTAAVAAATAAAVAAASAVKTPGDGSASPFVDYSERKNLFLFLQELCTLAKSLQVAIRDAFYKTLVDYGVFNVLEESLLVSDPKSQLWLWLAAADIITNMLNHDPQMLRTFLLSRIAADPTRPTLLGRLVNTCVSDVGSGLSHQLAQILKMLLDPESMQPNDKDNFLDHIYTHHIQKLVDALSETVPASMSHADIKRNHLHATASSATQQLQNQDARYHACELLSFCVLHHAFRIKNYIATHTVFPKVLSLLKSESRHLVCSAIRFLRTCIGLKDEFYTKKFVSGALLDPVIEVFVANGSRYNLLNSSVLELIHYICQANVRELVEYLVTRHSAAFQTITYVQTFQTLTERHASNLAEPVDLNKSQASQGSNGANGIDGKDEPHDSAYFETDDEPDAALDHHSIASVAGLSSSSSSSAALGHGLTRTTSTSGSSSLHLSPTKQEMEDQKFMERVKKGDDEVDFLAAVTKRKAAAAGGSPSSPGSSLSGSTSGSSSSSSSASGNSVGAKQPPTKKIKTSITLKIGSPTSTALLSASSPSAATGSPESTGKPSPTGSAATTPKSPVSPLSGAAVPPKSPPHAPITTIKLGISLGGAGALSSSSATATAAAAAAVAAAAASAAAGSSSSSLTPNLSSFSLTTPPASPLALSAHSGGSAASSGGSSGPGAGYHYGASTSSSGSAAAATSQQQTHSASVHVGAAATGNALGGSNSAPASPDRKNKKRKSFNETT